MGSVSQQAEDSVAWSGRDSVRVPLLRHLRQNRDNPAKRHRTVAAAPILVIASVISRNLVRGLSRVSSQTAKLIPRCQAHGLVAISSMRLVIASMSALVAMPDRTSRTDKSLVADTRYGHRFSNRRCWSPFAHFLGHFHFFRCYRSSWVITMNSANSATIPIVIDPTSNPVTQNRPWPGSIFHGRTRYPQEPADHLGFFNRPPHGNELRARIEGWGRPAEG